MYVLTCKILGNGKKIVISTDTEVWPAFILLISVFTKAKLTFGSCCFNIGQIKYSLTAAVQRRIFHEGEIDMSLGHVLVPLMILGVTFTELKCYLQEKSSNNVSTYDHYYEK